MYTKKKRCIYRRQKYIKKTEVYTESKRYTKKTRGIQRRQEVYK